MNGPEAKFVDDTKIDLQIVMRIEEPENYRWIKWLDKMFP